MSKQERRHRYRHSDDRPGRTKKQYGKYRQHKTHIGKGITLRDHRKLSLDKHEREVDDQLLELRNNKEAEPKETIAVYVDGEEPKVVVERN